MGIEAEERVENMIGMFRNLHNEFSTDGHEVCFQFLAVIDDVKVNNLVQLVP